MIAVLHYYPTHSIFKVDGYHKVSFQYEGRYAVLGPLNKSTKTILFAFHGQGQLAKYFIQKFKILQDIGITIIAPEGLHQYYLQGFSGHVGASWMTSENRLAAIENYISFLDSVYEDVLKQAAPNLKIHLLGFSQGAATVSRWVEISTFNFEQLILWGGALPPDLNKELIFNRVDGIQFLQVIGKDDPYITPEKEKEMKKLIEKYGLLATCHFYEGGHDINNNTLHKIFEM